MSENHSSGYKFDPEMIEELRDRVKRSGLDEFDEEAPDWLNQCEIEDALHLIRAGIAPSNVFNTPDWVREIGERYKDIENTPTLLSELTKKLEESEIQPIAEEVDDYPVPPVGNLEALDSLERQWNEITILGQKYRESVTDWNNSTVETPLEQLATGALSGVYPTPEILLSVAKSIRLYVLAAGELSLEEVFFGKPIRGVGSYANRHRKDQLMRAFHKDMRMQDIVVATLGDKHRRSREDLAELFLANALMDEEGNIPDDIDADSFLREYRRWKNKHMPDSDN